MSTQLNLSLKTYLNNDFSRNLLKVRDLLNSSETKVTPWGKRIITSPDFTGNISIDDLAKKLYITAILRNLCYHNLTLEERVAGMEIKQKLRSFYYLTDQQLQKSKITKTSNFIREFFSNTKEILNNYRTPRTNIETEINEGSFNLYTMEEYKKEFNNGEKPTRNPYTGHYPHSYAELDPFIAINKQVLIGKLNKMELQEMLQTKQKRLVKTPGIPFWVPSGGWK